ncbi:unnamed protein product [Amaranthus hypochondriacus]
MEVFISNLFTALEQSNSATQTQIELKVWKYVAESARPEAQSKFQLEKEELRRTIMAQKDVQIRCIQEFDSSLENHLLLPSLLHQVKASRSARLKLDEDGQREKEKHSERDQKTELTEKHNEGDLEECAEVVAKEEEHEDSTEVEVTKCRIVVDVVDDLVNPEVGENKSSVQVVHDILVAKSQSHREYRQHNSSGNIAQQFHFTRFLIRKFFENEYLGFLNKRKQRKRGRMRRRTARSKHLSIVFPVATTVIGEHGGEEWPAKMLWRRRRQLRPRAKLRRATRYGEGLGLILRLGIGFRFLHRNYISEFSPQTATTRNSDDTITVIGGDDDDAGEFREGVVGEARGDGCSSAKDGGGRSSLDFMQVVGVVDEGGTVIWANEQGLFLIVEDGGKVINEDEQGLFLIVEQGGKVTFESCLTAVNMRARGIEVNHPNYDPTAIVISPIMGWKCWITNYSNSFYMKVGYHT